MAKPLDLLRKLDDPSHFAALAPELAIEGRAAAPEAPRHDDAAEARWLEAEGLMTLPAAATPDECRRLGAAIEACLGDSLPATFLYVFDETWQLGERVRAWIERLLGRRYVLLADAWAWRIESGRGRGWPPHRGRSAPLFDRAAPEVLNAWVAITDATAERSCMHFVPLDDDPRYPTELERIDAPLETTRAVPVSGGTAVTWNANVLHWGGPCSARAVGPRMSCSFTLCRDDAAGALGLRSLDVQALDFRARVELIAEQIVTYGDGQPDVGEEVREWARILTSLASRKER